MPAVFLRPRRLAAIFSVLGFLCLGAAAQAQINWIWYKFPDAAEDAKPKFFRKIFELPFTATKAAVVFTGDDAASLKVNGSVVGSTRNWRQPVRADITRLLKPGANEMMIEARDADSKGGIALILELAGSDGKKMTLVTDPGWEFSSVPTSTNWQRSGVVARMGDAPWGDVFAPVPATAVETLKVLPGFKVELLHSALPEEGSWVSMTFDPRGRIIVSPQAGGLLRVTLSNAPGEKVEARRITGQIGNAMGLLYAYDSLYVSGEGAKGPGLYLLRDTDGDDQFDSGTLLRGIQSATGEHGSHALRLGPDGAIYYLHGNFVKVPQDVSPDSRHRNYAEDQLLPRAQDGNGFGNNTPPPGGFVLRMDPAAKNVELWASGLRNAYDFAFNSDGELFGFDSDMEWDWGMPWYRPTRVYHLVSGGDYGFREGSGKFPAYSQDMLPPVVDVGIGSPTGVEFGTKAKFPARYQRALFMMDWTYGRIMAAHLKPDGASYSGDVETIVQGRAFNVTDMEFGPDGALYFITGGRGTQTGLYRMTYVGADSTAPVSKEPAVAGSEEGKAAGLRVLRRSIERFHGKADPAALDEVWPHLDHSDRFIRYAARIAVEHLPVESWKARALSEPRTNAALTALMALARVGDKPTQPDLLKRLGAFPLDSLSAEQRLIKLRAIELSFIRQGTPSPELAKLAVEKLGKQFPSIDPIYNRELAQLLIYLRAPGFVAKSLALAEKAATQQEQIFYMFHLRTTLDDAQWTAAQRQEYFRWFNTMREGAEAPPNYPGSVGYFVPGNRKFPADFDGWFNAVLRKAGNGSSYPKFMDNFRREALAKVPDGEKPDIAQIIGEQTPSAKPLKAQAARQVVKAWKTEDLLPALPMASKGRNFARGKEAYMAAQCAACHRFGSEGGAVGPELTAIAARFSRKDLLESITEPSKVLSEQYQNSVYTLKNGDEVVGRVARALPDQVTVTVNPIDGTTVTLKKEQIAKRSVSKVSPMPEGLIDILTREEILDLLAYMESGGDANAPAFK